MKRDINYNLPVLLYGSETLSNINESTETAG